MIEFDVKIKGFDTLDRDIGEAIETELARVMEEGAEKARATHAFRDRSGALRASIHAGIEGSWEGGDLAGVLLADAEHASHVEKGTRPHVIVPSRGRALFWPGAKHPVARVNHPGTKATHFIRESVNPGAASNRLAAAAARAADKK